MLGSAAYPDKIVELVRKWVFPALLFVPFLFVKIEPVEIFRS